MKLEVGLTGHEAVVVSESDLASFAGNVGVDVLSTHRVVLLMEMAARNAVLGRIPEGKITLGTRIDIRHFAAAPPGARVRAEARLTAIEGRRLLFHVAAFDPFEKLAEGENEHILVSLEGFKNRVRQKMKWMDSPSR
jgi:predicted thioesterase